MNSLLTLNCDPTDFVFSNYNFNPTNRTFANISNKMYSSYKFLHGVMYSIYFQNEDNFV